jgi:hypothetical protein
MAEVPTDPAQRAILANQVLKNALFIEIMADLKQKQIKVFLSDAPVEEVLTARAIAKALEMVEIKFQSVLTTEKLRRKD